VSGEASAGASGEATAGASGEASAGASGEAIFYAIPGSHPARTGQLMLELKGIPFRRVNLVPGFHRVYVRVRGFPGDRVPAVLFPDGSRAQGTRPLARALDVMKPEPRLVPDDPRVEEAERWGDEVLQQWARRMVVEAGVRDPELLHEHGGAGRLGPLLTGSARSRRQMARLVKIAFGMSADQLRSDQGRVDEMLDHVDELIAAGVLNGEQLNCADLQIATSLALIEYRVDVRDRLRPRPAGELMARVLPQRA
jgi:glutathione S-transferase